MCAPAGAWRNLVSIPRNDTKGVAESSRNPLRRRDQARRVVANGVIRWCPAKRDPRGSPFQSPARLADGLGPGSDLGPGCPAPFAPSAHPMRTLVPPCRPAGRQASFGCKLQSTIHSHKMLGCQGDAAGRRPHPLLLLILIFLLILILFEISNLKSACSPRAPTRRCFCRHV